MTIRERIQVDGELISREDFTQYFNKVYETARANNLKLAYFDFFSVRLCYILINARSIM